LDQFLSTFTNRIDKKGRVSVPAEFRAVLAARQSSKLLLFPAVYFEALEGAADDYLVDLDKRIDSLPPFSEERDALIQSIKPNIVACSFDSEGRVGISAELKERAFLDDVATFVGLGSSFQIWQPERWAIRQRELRSPKRPRP